MRDCIQSPTKAEKLSDAEIRTPATMHQCGQNSRRSGGNPNIEDEKRESYAILVGVCTMNVSTFQLERCEISAELGRVASHESRRANPKRQWRLHGVKGGG
jgi:hypothetical protein